MNLFGVVTQGGVISQVVAMLLLAMSVASWVVILWKAWLLKRAVGDVARSIAAFWQSASIDEAAGKVAAFDREALVLPLISATKIDTRGTLATAGDKSQQLTRVLRDALHAVLHKLQFGQVLLATVGSTAPFVGLLGTVWGIYHALIGIASAGQITIDKVSGPVGEALIMTAAGLAVAIPAVLAYNIFGRFISRIEADLEGFARDLRELLAPTPVASRATLSQEGVGFPEGGPPENLLAAGPQPAN
ncbi:MAG: MotA/TolQ/ExbB proton channel family protein [Pseudomonadota bacterium]